MLIFDGFQSKAKAYDFQNEVNARYKKIARVCATQEEANKIDPFPYHLAGTIVLVERDDNSSVELAIQALASKHGGNFAGT